MKLLYTSYYAKNARNPKAVAISARAPDFYQGKVFPELAPTIQLVYAYKQGRITEEEYTEAYLKILKENGMTPEKVVDLLDDGSVLLCYEKPSEFCHRFILAHWIEKNTGLVVPEQIVASPKKPGTNAVRDDLLIF